MAAVARLLCAVLLALACAGTGGALAAERIRIAMQKTGTLAWELDVMRAAGTLATPYYEVVISELASPEAGKIALKSGVADVIVSDWLWVARDRSLGGHLAFYPYASALGAVMVRPDSGIHRLDDLKGKRIAVAGGALDKSWLLLQGLARRHGLDLKSQATIAYGAPPLLSQKAIEGEHDATLTFWNFAALLEAKGFAAAFDIAEVERELGASGSVAFLGYVFDAEWAGRNRKALDHFLKAAFAAKERLARSPDEWSKLAPRIGASAPADLAIFARRYAEGIPRRPIEDEERDARTLFGALVETGGADLVGRASTLDTGLFWHLDRGS